MQSGFMKRLLGKAMRRLFRELMPENESPKNFSKAGPLNGSMKRTNTQWNLLWRFRPKSIILTVKKRNNGKKI